MSCVPFGLKHAVLEIAHGMQQAHDAGSLSQSLSVKQHNKYPDYSPEVSGALSLMLGMQEVDPSSLSPSHLNSIVLCANTTVELATTYVQQYI